MSAILSWNVNGLRAVAKKGFGAWLEQAAPDILCLQETKLQEEQVSEELRGPAGYRSYWACARKKGYSGVATYSRDEPLDVQKLGDPRFDDEGRVLMSEHPGFVLLNCYFPNSQEAGARLDYKLEFCEALLERCRALVSGKKNLIVCGDFNIAHRPIDLTYPRQNEKNPGYLPEERAWMDSFLAAGFVDSFRMFVQDGGHYSWWSYRFNARQKNIGWRIDYHCVNEGFAQRVTSASILMDVMGSDHCPVSITVSD